MAYGQPSDHRGMDRSYNRGAVMGLTVAEAFILLAFCLLLLFTWWQVETEEKSLMAAEQIGNLTDAEKEQIIAGLSDGTFELAQALREAGLGSTQPQDLAEVTLHERGGSAAPDGSLREALARDTTHIGRYR